MAVDLGQTRRNGYCKNVMLRKALHHNMRFALTGFLNSSPVAPRCCIYGMPACLQAPKSRTLKTAANLFISFLGAGVLGLPYAFRRSGLTQGVVFMLIIVVLNIHCMMLLVSCTVQREYVTKYRCSNSLYSVSRGC